MNTALFVNATIGFSEKLFLVFSFTHLFQVDICDEPCQNESLLEKMTLSLFATVEFYRE